MPAYSKETTEYHKKRIQQILTIDPTATVAAIENALIESDEPLKLHRLYIGRLIGKIKGEMLHRFDFTKVEERLSQIQNRNEIVIREMMRILTNPITPSAERIAAGRTIVETESRYFEMQQNAGIFERKLGTIDVIHEHRLAPELAVPIIRALRNYGIIHTPTTVIEHKPSALPQPNTPA
ncbi:MAG: hypothetical protein AB1352_03605 [Patescibacteria group bacterium]